MKNSDSSFPERGDWEVGEIVQLTFFVIVVALVGWLMHQLNQSGAPAWKSLLLVWFAFHVVWLGPPLWGEYVAWIARRLNRGKQH